MGAATVLKTVKLFVDFIPDPVKTPVSALLEISITTCERVEQVTENVQAVADLAEQQAGISADVVNELRGVTQAQIDSGDWVRRLKNLTDTLEKVRVWVFKDSEDVKCDGKSAKTLAKAVKAVAKLWNSEEKKGEIDALKAELDRTRNQLELQLAITTLIGVQHVTEILRQLMRFHDRMLVNRLKPVFSARYGAHGSPGDCLEHTRLALLNDLREYLTANDGRRIVWLYGLAGTGKSTVARSICSGLKDTHDVVSFFIKRDIFDHSNQKRILHTLVYQLAQCIPQVFSAVIHAKDDLFEAHVHDQVEDLVRTPLSAVLPGARPVVIILDAVDERGGTKNECDIIPCFLDAIAAAQVPVRVFVTSRGQPSDFLRPTYDSEAVHATQGLPLSLVQYVLIHHKSYDPEGDIRAYLAAEFKRVALKRTVSDWPPSPDQIDILVRMSARLFIFAATIIRWVDCSAPVFALGQLLEQSSALMERTGPETIFALYEYVICHALDEDTPRQLLRSALGKDPNDRTEADALCREATLSILSTVRCLRERLTRNVFAHLWAGHIIAEPTIRAGAVAIAEHLISRLSGVLFVWNPDSSVMLLHASFGDFLDARSSPYHISSETTHFELASKCVSIMLSTKDAYDQFHSTSFVDPLLNRRLDAIPWIGPDSDLAARYSFAHWIPHASRALPTQLPRLLEQVRLAERGFWSAGVFLHPADINVDSLKQAHNAMRTHREGVEAAYTLATVVYMCADEASDFKDASRRRGLNSFDTVLDALSILAPLSGSTRSDCVINAENRIEALDQLLGDVLAVLDQWIRSLSYPGLFALIDARHLGEPWLRINNLVSKLNLALNTEQKKANNSTGNWPTKSSIRIHILADILAAMSLRFRAERVVREEITEELEKWANELRYALRELKYEIVKPYDEQFIAARARRNAGLIDEPTHEGDAPLDSTLSSGHPLDGDAPPRPDRQMLQVDEVLPPELHSVGSVDPSPSEGQSLLVDEPHPGLSEGQSSQVVTPLPREEHATVTTSTASAVCFFAVLVLLYVLLSSLFA